jgi:hypothetical protein
VVGGERTALQQLLLVAQPHSSEASVLCVLKVALLKGEGGIASASAGFVTSLRHSS